MSPSQKVARGLIAVMVGLVVGSGFWTFLFEARGVERFVVFCAVVAFVVLAWMVYRYVGDLP